MDTRRTRTERKAGTALGRVGLYVLLLGVCAAIVFGATRLLRSSEPVVDFSKRAQPSAAAPDTLEQGDRLRFAVTTMVSAEATFSTYRRLVSRIARDIGRRETFIVPPTYRVARQALESGKIDVAFVCTGTYVSAYRSHQVKLLVQPEFDSQLQYRSLIIVPAASHFKDISDLQGAVMAFSDPESHTGCYIPSDMLINRGYNPKTYFRKVVFTGSHDRSILAVAVGAVDAAAVHSLVWESNVRHDPSLARRVRIIWQSEVYGPPCIVVPEGLDEDLERSLRDAFLALDKDDEGREILSIIGIKRFILPRPDDYLTALELYQRLEQYGDVLWH